MVTNLRSLETSTEYPMQQTGYVQPRLFQYMPTVCDAGPILNQPWAIISCFLGPGCEQPRSSWDVPIKQNILRDISSQTWSSARYYASFRWISWCANLTNRFVTS